MQKAHRMARFTLKQPSAPRSSSCRKSQLRKTARIDMARSFMSNSVTRGVDMKRSAMVCQAPSAFVTNGNGT